MKERSYGWSWRCVGLALVGSALAGLAIFGICTLDENRAAAQQPGVQVLPGGPFLQGGRIRLPESDVVDVFLPVDRDTTRQWEKAKSLIDDARYGDGVTLLDEILQRGDDFFFKPDADKPNYRSLKAEAQQLIGSLPREGRDSYELQFGARASQMLTAASSSGDVARLEEVVRRYFHTPAGYQATLILGKLHLDHDRPLAAVMCFKRLRDTPEAADKFEPSLSALLAHSYLRANLTEEARDTIVQLKKKDSQATIRLAGKSVRLFSDDRRALAWLQENLGNRQPAPPKELENWTLPRGNPARNAVSAGGLPLLNPRWRVSTTDHPTLETTLADIRKYFIDQGAAALPAMQPLAVGDLVLMRTARDLFAVDFVTGLRLWPIRSTGDAAVEQFLPSSSSAGASSDPQSNFGLTQRFWQDVTFGTLASDGQQVFLIDDLDVAPNRPIADMNGQFGQPARVRPGRWIGGGFDAESLGYKRYNRLAAHELRTQGKLTWQIGGPTGEDEPKLAEAFFLGPPLPLQGKLYVLAEIKGEIKLCVLDAKNGRLDWSQQVALVDQNIQIDPYRRLAGCTPSFADGVLVCPTSAGAIVAIDIANRTLLWGYRYDRDRPNQYPNVIMMRPGVQLSMPNNPAERWLDSNVTIGEGKVLVTPAESNQLYCLQLLDGQPAWTPQPRGDNLYVAGIHQGKAVLVNKRQLITAIQLKDGKPVMWKTSPAGAAPQVVNPDTIATVMPSGRGFLSGDDYFLPLTSAEVVRFDLVAGKIADRKKSRSGTIPGNLICHRGDVISQGVDFVESFFQIEPLQQRVAKTLSERPDDPWALAHRGEIALEEGRVDQAVADVRRAYQSEPTPFTRDLLIQALQAGLTKDFAKHRGALHDLEQLVKLDRERAMFLRVLAAGLQQSGETSGALDAYLRLAALQGEAGELEEIDAQHSVWRPRWIRAQFAALLESANPKDRAAIDTAMGRQVERVLAADPRGNVASAAALRQFLNCFGDHPLAERARGALADLLAGTEANLEREQLLLKLEKSSEPQRRRSAAAKLASLLSENGQFDAAVATYRRLKADAGTQVVLNGKSASQILAALPADSPLRRAEAQDSAWPEGAVKVETNANAKPQRTGGIARTFNLELHGSREPFFSNVNVSKVVETDQWQEFILGVDGLGRDLFRVAVGDQNRTRANLFNPFQAGFLNTCAFARGHVLVVSNGTHVFGIDTLHGSSLTGNRVLWQRELCDPALMSNGMAQQREATAWGTTRHARSPLNNAIGEVAMCGEHTLCIQRGRESDVTAIDPLTGNVLWVQHKMEPGCDIFGDDEIVVLAAKGRPTKILRTLDGKLLEERSAAPPADDPWTTFGRNVLTWRSHSNGNRLLAMVDPSNPRENQRDLWKVEFSQGVKGDLVDGRFAALLQPDGKFVMLDLTNGRKVIDEKLLPAPGLQNIYVLSSSQQLILATNSPSAERSGRGRAANANIQPAMSNGNVEFPAPLITGHIYAFDRATGKPQWPVPAFVEKHGLVLAQPADLPVLAFVRNAPTATNPQGGSILCLDKRNGRLLYEDDDLPQPINSWSALGNLTERTVTLLPSGQPITLRFTGAPQPPEPPYQAGAFEKAEAAAPRGQPAPNRSPADRG